MDTRTFISALGFRPMKLLGSGAYGESWLLSNGDVIKITSSNAEEFCTTQLFGLQDTPHYSIHLPQIYEIGHVPPDVRFLPETMVDREHWLLGPQPWPGHPNPHFYYIREDLSDLPLPKEPSEDDAFYMEDQTEFLVLLQNLKDRLKEIATEIWDKTGLAVIDLHAENFGLRQGTDSIVLRDLTCGNENNWWEGMEQRIKIAFAVPEFLEEEEPEDDDPDAFFLGPIN